MGAEERAAEQKERNKNKQLKQAVNYLRKSLAMYFTQINLNLSKFNLPFSC